MGRYPNSSEQRLAERPGGSFHAAPPRAAAFRSFRVRFADPEDSRLTIVSRWNSREAAEAGVIGPVEVANEPRQCAPEGRTWHHRTGDQFRC